jgi:hypothetical protein
VFGAAVKFAFVLLKLSIPNFALAHPNLVPLLSSYQKFPPGLTYICFYAGAGLLLVAGVLDAARPGIVLLVRASVSPLQRFASKAAAPLHSRMAPAFRPVACAAGGGSGGLEFDRGKPLLNGRYRAPSRAKGRSKAREA